MTTLTPRMGRPPSYTPEMDEVILSIPQTKEVQKVFAENGWPHRSGGAILQRRRYLKGQGLGTDYDAHNLTERYKRLLARKRRLVAEVITCRARLSELEEELATLNDNILRTLEELQDEATDEVGE